MYARPKPAAFAVSLLAHGFILAWVASGPVREKPKSLYAQAIAPHASKLVWYHFREKLPDVSPTAAPKSAKAPRVDVRAPQKIVAATAKAHRAEQFVWQPVPKLELHTDLQSPNVLAIRVVRPEPPPKPSKPKLFAPPPKTPPPTADAPMLAAPPEIHSARNLNGAVKIVGTQPVKAPPRKFVAPPAGRPVDQPARALPALPDAPAVAANPAMAAPPVLGSVASKSSPFPPEPPAAPAISVAIVGLNPTEHAPAAPPEGSRNAAFSAGPQPRSKGGTDSPADGAMLTLPGLFVHNATPDTTAAAMAMARASPTSEANLRAAMRGSLPASSIAGAHPTAFRVSSAPDPLFSGRDTFALSVQMPNITSYSGSWMIWFALRDESAPGGLLTPPVPIHKVDPKYYPAAMADRVEGRVRLAAVIRKNGSVDSVMLLQHLDERLDQSSQEAMYQWLFEPALRNGQPVDVDAIFEIPFRLAPPVKR
jgi:TonB family protein